MKIIRLFRGTTATLLAAAALFSSTSSSRAALRASEPFNFPSTFLVTAAGVGSGSGWAGNWTGTANTVAMPNDSTSLIYPAGSAFATSGQRISAASGTATRVISTTFTTGGSGTVYVSFLARRTSTGAFSVSANNGSSQIRWVPIAVTAAGNVTCTGGATGSSTAAAAFGSGTTDLVVAKLISGSPQAFVKLYAPGDVIPTSDTGLAWTASVTGGSAVTQDRFQIAVTAGTVELDEFLYGTTWGDVVGNMTKANNATALNVAGSWSGGVLPGTSDTPVWNNTVAAANTTNSLGADTTWGGMAVRNPGGLVTINAGNTLTLGAAATEIDMSAATADLTLSCPLVMGAANVWNVAANRTLTLGGVVSGVLANNVTKQGAGTAKLSVANSYTGETIFNAGVINVASLATYATEAASGSPLGGRTLAQDTSSSIGLHFTGGSLQYTGSGAQSTDRHIRVLANTTATIDASGATSADTVTFSQFAAPINFWDVGTSGRSVMLTGNNTGNNTFALNIPDFNSVSSKTSLIKSGTGTWDVTNTHNSDAVTSTAGTFGGYTGGTTISGGTLGFVSSALGASGTIGFTGNATLRWNGGNTQDLSSRIKIEDGITATIDTGANTVPFTSGLLVGTLKTGALTKAGSGKLTLGTSPIYTGLTTINAGTFALASGIALDSASSVSIAAGATLDVSASSTYTWGSGASLIASGTGTTVGSTAAEIKAGAGTTGIDLGSRPVTLNFTPTTLAGDATEPALYVSSGVLNVNSPVTVNNNGASPLGNGTYVLIKAANASTTGTPTFNGIVGGQGIVAGKNALIQRNGTTGDIELTVQDALTPTIALTRHSGTVDSSTYGAALQFDFSVSGSGATPTGTVELRDGSPSGTLLNNGTLSGGTVTLSPSALNALIAGTHTLYALYSGDSLYTTGNGTLSQTVVPLSVTVTGASASSKMFDNTTAATITGGTVVTPVTGDTMVEINVTSVGTFSNVGPGPTIGVNVALGGTKASSYSLTQPGLTADILTLAIWTATATPAAWDTAANWQNNLVGTGSGNTADFNTVDITADTTVNLNSARTIGSLIFGDTDSSGASWTLANNGVAGNKLILAGTTPTVTVNNLGTTGKTTISAVVDGTAGLTKSGPGTLALTGANTYTGGTVINSSTLTITADGALGAVPGSATPGNITLNGGTLQSAAAGLGFNDNRGISIGSGGGTIVNGGGGTMICNAAIAGPGLLTWNTPVASSALNINHLNTYSGGTVINGPASATVACLATSSGPAGSPTSGPFGTGPITWNGPSTRSTTGVGGATIGNAIIFAADTTFVSAGGEQTLTFTGPVTLSGGSRILTVNIGASVATKSLTLSGAIGDGGNTYGLTKAGTGNLVLSGSNTYTGNTTVNAGTLELASTGQLKFVLGASSGTNNSITGSGTVSLKGSFVIDTSAADSLSTGSWTLENVLTLTGAYDASFSVSGFTDAGSNKWTKVNGTKIYTFDETTGILTFGPAGYSSWASTNAPTGTPGDDYDGDGVSNAVEYILGGTKDTNDLSKQPALDASGANLVFTFKRDRASIDGTTSVAIQVGTTLALWPSSYTVGTTTAGSTTGVTVDENNPSGFDTVTLTVAKGADAAKFARLVVTPTP